MLNIVPSFSQVLSLQHSGSDSSHSQFASYWKPILSMDANFWQRWLHMHRIVVLLEHDTYVTGRAELCAHSGPAWESRVSRTCSSSAGAYGPGKGLTSGA